MKNIKNFSIFPLLIMSVFLVFASSCKKEDDNNGGNENVFTDQRDGNVYHTVAIGTQVWMVENLRYLPNVDGILTGSPTTPRYYVYGYDGTSVSAAKATANYTTMGVLYNWPAAMNGEVSSSSNPSGVQGICPQGWHLPSDAEWKTLSDYLGGEDIAGAKMKSKEGWYDNGNGTNESGFTALPSGYRNSRADGSGGSFEDFGVYCGWWSSSDGPANLIWDHYINTYYNGDKLARQAGGKARGMCVRCLRD